MRRVKTAIRILAAADRREKQISRYNSEVYSSLLRARLIATIRGHQGGSYLERIPESITLLEIYEAVHGSLGNSDIFDSYLRQSFRKVTLADFLPEKNK